MNLETPIREISRIYKMYSSRLEKLGIIKLEDFLYHIPFRYDDFSIISKIGRVQAGETVTIEGKVTEFKNEFTRKWKKLQKAKIEDETGSIDAIWFNQPYLSRVIKTGDNIFLSGKIGWYLGKIVMQSPEYEIKEENQIHTGRLVPVYPETRGISSKWLRRQIFKLLQENVIEDYLPIDIIKREGLMNLNEALFAIHFPENFEKSHKSRKRLEFDELFLIQTASIIRKNEWNKSVIKKPLEVSKFKKQIEEFKKNLPFELTNSQQKVIEEIFEDFSKAKPMNRLLEGEVGSGKTVVGAIAAYLAFLNGYQSAFMAPTEILAEQHYKTISNLLKPLGMNVGLRTGSSDTKDIVQNADILIGTHALLYKDIEFKNLGFIIIDEQQRFGVEQRELVRKKGINPHVLTMTATPIPRTVALTLYGDLDLSFINEMPKDRKKVKTWLVPVEKRQSAYKWIEKQITQNGDQAFILCPFIEESENSATVKAATKEYKRLKAEVFPKLNLGLLHGKLKAKEKEEVLEKFRKGKIDILVTTPVVEVGIDVSNATIMMIEASERFGLAQLHQLRGRVGRGNKQSYCLLFTESDNENTIKKLKALETIYFGPELAELDLKLRGPGQIFGTIQHGKSFLKIASFSDFELIEKTKKEAEKVASEILKYPLIIKKIKSINAQEVASN